MQDKILISPLKGDGKISETFCVYGNTGYVLKWLLVLWSPYRWSFDGESLLDGERGWVVRGGR
jgi:hypothetical protein